MNWIYKIVAENSHEIYCWSIALLIDGLAIGFVITIGYFWDQAYRDGYEKGYKDAKSDDQ